MSADKDENGAYFIDRSGDLFKICLEYLRTGKIFLPLGCSEEQLALEMDFYQMSIPKLHFPMIEEMKVMEVNRILNAKKSAKEWLERSQQYFSCFVSLSTPWRSSYEVFVLNYEQQQLTSEIRQKCLTLEKSQQEFEEKNKYVKQMNQQMMSKVQLEYNQLQLFRPKSYSKNSPNFELWSTELCNLLKEECDITTTFEEKQKVVCGYALDGIMFYLQIYNSLGKSDQHF